MAKNSASSLPAHASVVVIGGGIMGCSTLYHLAHAGVSDAVLLERNKLTSGTTWHSAAQVRALRSTQNMTDLIRYSISLYSGLEKETGQNVGWINKGSLSIATNEDRLIHIRRQDVLAQLFGVRAETISPEAAKERWPLMYGDDIIGAVWSPDDGRVSPSDLCAALVKGAKAHGASIFEDTGILAIITKGGRIIGVETTSGYIQTEAIALCAGLWSREVGAMAGAKVPVWPCEHFYLLTKAVPGVEGNLPTLSDHDGHLYIRDDSGGLLIGCFEPMGKALDPDRLGADFAFQLLPEDWDHFEPMMHNALHRLPALRSAEVKMLLNGPESFTPDGNFLLGEAAETPGLFLGCGMNSVGVATGGGAGMALAHTILTGSPPMDLHEVDPKRFASALNHVDILAARVPEILGKHYEITYPGRQWTTSRNLKYLPLHDEWVKEKAHFGQIFGYELPLYFSKIKEPTLKFGRPDWFEQVGREVMMATSKAVITDLSSYGKFDIKGGDAGKFLNHLCTNKINSEIGRVTYTLMLTPKGKIKSDLTVFCLAENHYRLVGGTMARIRDLAWIQRHLDSQMDVSVCDVTDDLAIMGLMGPDTPAIAEKLNAGWLNDLGYFRQASGTIAGIDVKAARLSYIGERGWEITCCKSEAKQLYDLFYKLGARPIGGFAQTSMRIEKGFAAYGPDINSDMIPAMANLSFAVDMKTDFIGKEALQQDSNNNADITLVSLILDEEHINPHGDETVHMDGKIIGKTTSASYGYRVGKPVALALMARKQAKIGAKLEINIAGSLHGCTLVMGGVFDPIGERMKKHLY